MMKWEAVASILKPSALGRNSKALKNPAGHVPESELFAPIWKPATPVRAGFLKVLKW